VLELELSAVPVSLPEVLALNQEDWPAKDRGSERLRAEVLEYANDVLTGLLLEHADIDAAIDELSTDWRLERLSATDRCILRIALCELRRGLEPPAVIIDEAVELAREYGGTDSPKFVNGVLGAWLRGANGDEQ
jgi:transcription antitermination factor NusB